MKTSSLVGQCFATPDSVWLFGRLSQAPDRESFLYGIALASKTSFGVTPTTYAANPKCNNGNMRLRISALPQ